MRLLSLLCSMSSSVVGTFGNRHFVSENIFNQSCWTPRHQTHLMLVCLHPHFAYPHIPSSFQLRSRSFRSECFVSVHPADRARLSSPPRRLSWFVRLIRSRVLMILHLEHIWHDLQSSMAVQKRTWYRRMVLTLVETL